MRQVVKNEWSGGYEWRAEVRGAWVTGWAKSLVEAEQQAADADATMHRTFRSLDAHGVR